MPPDQLQRLLIIGIMVTSAIYLTGCWASGILTGNPWAWKSALAGVGLAYIGYYLQVLNFPREFQIGPVVLSIGCGLFSGLALLVR